MNMPKIKFVHFRNYDPFLNAIDNMGGSTVAYIETPEGFEYAVAQCSDQDNFNKRLGRSKAAGRLNSPVRRRVFPGNDRKKFYDELHNLYDEQALTV